MKKIIPIILAMFVFSTIGCNKVLSIFYGIRQPEYETEQSLARFEQETFGEVIPYFTLDVNRWKEGRLPQNPDVIVFDSKGNYIPHRDSLKPNCNGPAELFLSELNTGRAYHYDASLSISTLLNDYHKPGCAGKAEISTTDVDFLVFITYAKWSGEKIIRQKSLRWISALKANKNIRYNLYLLNSDLQDCWSQSDKDFFNKKNSGG
jgi:hypothetical protein